MLPSKISPTIWRSLSNTGEPELPPITSFVEQKFSGVERAISQLCFARNQLSGSVVAVNRGEAIANIEVEVAGQRLIASITVEAVDDLGLEPGKAVTAVIKASDVMIATD